MKTEKNAGNTALIISDVPTLYCLRRLIFFMKRNSINLAKRA